MVPGDRARATVLPFLLGLLPVLALTGCAAGGKALGLRADVRAGHPAASQDWAPETAGGYAARQVRVVILARGDAGWPTLIQGATVRALDRNAGAVHEQTTGPDGAAIFQARGPLELWVRLTREDAPEPIPWGPIPDDVVPNQSLIVHVLGASR